MGRGVEIYFSMTLAQQIQHHFGMSPQEIAKIEGFFHSISIAKGEYLLKEGQYARRMAFVEKGYIRIYAHQGEKEVTQWITTPGYFVMDLASFIFEMPARWNIEALEDCRLHVINRADYQKIGEYVPNWHLLEKSFLARCFITLENRMFQQLSLSAEERYRFLFEYQPDLFNQVPLQYLASMLGMTPETFSRIRKKRMKKSS